MGRSLTYTTLDRIISKLYRDLGLEEISETDIIEWAGEALEFIGAVTLLEEAVAFVEVKNHQAKLPNGLHNIIQVARDNHYERKEICPVNVMIDSTTLPETKEDIDIKDPDCCPIPINCDGVPIELYDVAYYRPYFDLQYEYSGWMGSRVYQERYTPVRLSNHTFFNSIVCEEDKNLYQGCSDEYTIIADTIRTSFQEGSVAIAYRRQKVDPETGYPMVPDEVSVISAITYYITWKFMARMWYMGREGYSDKMQVAEQQWHWYCGQAGTKQMMLYGEDQHQNFTETRNHLIPRRNNYYGYFGKLGRAENTGFKDTRRDFSLRGI